MKENTVLTPLHILNSVLRLHAHEFFINLSSKISLHQEVNHKQKHSQLRVIKLLHSGRQDTTVVAASNPIKNLTYNFT